MYNSALPLALGGLSLSFAALSIIGMHVGLSEQFNSDVVGPGRCVTIGYSSGVLSPVNEKSEFWACTSEKAPTGVAFVTPDGGCLNIKFSNTVGQEPVDICAAVRRAGGVEAVLSAPAPSGR